MTTVQKPRSRRRAAGEAALAPVFEAFSRFRELKKAEALAKQGHETLRDEKLMPALEKYGEAHGENGQHLAIPLPEPIDGFTRLVRRANTSTYINIDRAEALAEERGFLPHIQTTTVTVRVPAERLPAMAKLIASLEKLEGAEVFTTTLFDQDRLYAYHQAHRDQLTEQEMDSLLDSDTRYSFHPEK